MAEIRVNVTASKSQRVNVSSSNIATEISATPDTSQYYSNLAKNWAIAENIVNNEDYSSKHYAKEAQQASELANAYKEATEQAYNSFGEQYANAETELTAIKDASVQEINTAVTDGKTEITTTKDLAIDAVNNTKTTILNDIEFVADGEKEEIRDLADDIKENASDIINRVSLSMFDTILKDHVLTYEESKGLALQGTYVYKTAIAGERYGYADFYNKVLEEYNEATATETVNGVTVKVHSNGHKFYDIANKSAIDSSFNSLGTAWFYGVDIENERIFLPRNNYITSYITNGNKTVNIKGNGKAIGFSNSINNFGLIIGGGNEYYRVLFESSTDAYGKNIGTQSNVAQVDAGKAVGLTTDSTKSGITGTVNITNTQTGQYLYICVGNTVSDTSWIDVVTQVEGGVKDLEDKTQEGLNRLNTTTNNSIADIHTMAKSYDTLTHRNITNCLLEVPQRIKYELTGGNVVIKAGSEFVIPDGFEADGTTPKFTYIKKEADFVIKGTYINGTAYYVYNAITGGLDFVSTTSSANSQITTYGVNYNTSTNNIKLYSSNNVIYSDKVSFPFIQVTGNGTQITSINQVFNGFGYIGSAFWVDKDVKFLVPNGRNKDGSLNNIEYTTSSIRVSKWGVYADANSLLFYVADGNIVHSKYFGECTDKVPPPSGANGTYFNPRENIIYYNNLQSWVARSCVLLGEIYADSSGRITGFKAKQPFRAIDYSDKSEISGWGMLSNKYIDLTLGANGAEYTAPANGFVIFSKKSTANNQHLRIGVNGTICVQNKSVGSNDDLYTTLQVRKGVKFQVLYTAAGTTNYFRFYYAEGDK